MTAAGRFARMTRRERVVLIVCAGAVLIAMIDRLAVAPILDKMRTLESQISMTEEQLYRDVRMVAQRERIEAEEKRYSLFSGPAMSDEATTAALLRTVEGLASAASVQITDLKPGGVRQDGPIKSFMVSLNCEAEMEQLMSFFHRLESADAMIEISAFTLTPKSRQSSVARCELMLQKNTLP